MGDAGWLATAGSEARTRLARSNREPVVGRAKLIDYVFHTPDLVVADAGVIQSRASDHFPVVVDIDLR